MVEAVQSNRQIQVIDLSKNPLPLNFVEKIDIVLQQNIIRAARNKVPQFKNEVL